MKPVIRNVALSAKKLASTKGAKFAGFATMAGGGTYLGLSAAGAGIEKFGSAVGTAVDNSGLRDAVSLFVPDKDTAGDVNGNASTNKGGNVTSTQKGISMIITVGMVILVVILGVKLLQHFKIFKRR